jgi:hypothetical protein
MMRGAIVVLEVALVFSIGWYAEGGGHYRRRRSGSRDGGVGMA